MRISPWLLAAAMWLVTEALAEAGEPAADWQEFPSLRLTRSMVRYELLSYIARPKSEGPSQYRDAPQPPHTAGLDAELVLDASGPALRIGTLVHAGSYVQVIRTEQWIPSRPLSTQWDAGTLGSPLLEGPQLLKEDADWAHNRLVFRGRWPQGQRPSAEDAEPELAVTLSRLTPAILLETNTGQLAIFGGMPQPAKGIRFAASDGRTVAVGSLNGAKPNVGDLRKGWLLLFWGKMDPAVYDLGWGRTAKIARDRHPVLMIFSDNPVAIEAGSGLVIKFAARHVKVVLLPLGGIDFPRGDEQEKWDSGLPEDVVERCDWWAARLSAYPETVREGCSYDAATDRVSVIEQIRHVKVRDGAVLCAPVPPTLALAAASEFPVKYSSPVTDCHHRTAYGPYMVVDKVDCYAWSVAGLSKYVFDRQVVGPSTSESRALEEELAAEMDKVLAEEYLAPWVYETRRFGPQGDVYWRQPWETDYFLAQVMPVLDPDRRAKVAFNLKAFNQRFPMFEVAAMPTWTGPRRERYNAGKDKYYEQIGNPQKITLAAARGMADYFEVTAQRPAPEVWQRLSRLLRDSLDGADWATGFWCLDRAPELPPQARTVGMDLELPTKIVNRRIGEIAGLLRMAKMCGQRDMDAALAWGRLTRELALRLALAKYARWILPPDGPVPLTPRWNAREGADQVRTMNQFEVNLNDDTQDWRKSVYVAFLDMGPEAARFLADYAREECVAFLEAVDRSWPQWHLANMTSEIGGDSSAGLVQPVNSYALFMAWAWIKKDAPENLKRRLDVSWLDRGDFFYMHKLAETAKAYRAVKWEGSRQ